MENTKLTQPAPGVSKYYCVIVQVAPYTSHSCIFSHGLELSSRKIFMTLKLVNSMQRARSWVQMPFYDFHVEILWLQRCCTSSF